MEIEKTSKSRPNPTPSAISVSLAFRGFPVQTRGKIILGSVKVSVRPDGRGELCWNSSKSPRQKSRGRFPIAPDFILPSAFASRPGQFVKDFLDDRAANFKF
jgi:hypothetical protein